jgi:hypothetical protein
VTEDGSNSGEGFPQARWPERNTIEKVSHEPVCGKPRVYQWSFHVPGHVCRPNHHFDNVVCRSKIRDALVFARDVWGIVCCMRFVYVWQRFSC